MKSSNQVSSTTINFKKITEQLVKAADNDRFVLYEHEVYRLLDYTGAVSAPVSQFVPKDGEISDEQLASFKNDRVVIKIVSASIAHKTEVGGVKIIENQPSVIRQEAATMLEQVSKSFDDVHGLLIVDFIPAETRAFGSELLVGIRNTREFGLTISAGIGGTNTEIFAEGFSKGLPVTSASVEMNDGHSFFKIFKSTLAYKLISGQTRGRESYISDEKLISSFDCLIELAKYYSASNPEAPFVIDELEINPFAFIDQRIVPLDGLCRFNHRKELPNPRPINKIDKLMHPSSIGIIGVSANKMNFGRIILSNLIKTGYDKDKITIIKPGADEIDGVKCIESLSALEQKLDLFIVAVASDAVFGLVDEIIETDSVESVMLIPGGLGETEASRERVAVMNAKINQAHVREQAGPVFLGGNCLGVVSHPGGYDSWFIPKEKLPMLRKKQTRNSAFISQSGAFMITRLSQNPWFDPAYMAALGNQNDLTHGDMLSYYVDNPLVDIIGVYVEGFNDFDGLNFAKAVRRAAKKGKQVVVYKAGRSSAGQAAAMGHTASIAGDYAICDEILQQAGAITCSSINEFSNIFYLASMLHDKEIRGNRLGAVSGAGFETVGIADSLQIDNMRMEIAELTAQTNQRLQEILTAKRLDALMEVRNPFDINPGADDEAHILCAEAMCDDPNVDAVVVGLDPLSPMMRTMVKSSRPGFDISSDKSIVQLMPKLVAAKNKPILGVMDGGELYTPAIEQLKDAGVAIFRSCDQATYALTKYTEGRLRINKIRQQSQQ